MTELITSGYGITVLISDIRINIHEVPSSYMVSEFKAYRSEA